MGKIMERETLGMGKAEDNQRSDSDDVEREEDQNRMMGREEQIVFGGVTQHK